MKLHHQANRLISKQIRTTYIKVTTPEVLGEYSIQVVINHEELPNDRDFPFEVKDVTDEVKKLRKKVRTVKIKE